MAEAIISPGVYQRENDLSFIQPQPTEAGTAIIGPAVKGPIGVPTVVTSYNDYVRKFGDTFVSGSSNYEFLTSVTARNYFQNSGNTLIVTRVVEGDFTAAKSNPILNAKGLESFRLETLSKGDNQNSAANVGDFNNYVDVYIRDGYFDEDLFNADEQILHSGSKDNIRWEVINRDTTAGTFSLAVRRGNDTDSSKVILETFSNLSLDPHSDRYIERVIGNSSKYFDATNKIIRDEGEFSNNSNFVRVSAVYNPTPNYLANDGTTINSDTYGVSYTSSLPALGGGGFVGASGSISNRYVTVPNTANNNIQGLTTSSYDDAITLLENKDEYQINTIVVPGANIQQHSSLISKVTSLAETRGDAIAVVDAVPTMGSVNDAIKAAAGVNSSYSATYYPQVQVVSATGKQIYVPASVVIPGVYAFTDASAAPWYAPAGLVRGGIPGVLQAERKLSKSERDTLYSGKVNPIATFPGTGIAVFGQKTLQVKASALDRVNVRRLMIELKKFIGDQSKNLIFEQNTIATRNKFLARVNPYLDSVVQRNGLYAYRVVMDDTNNTADVVDRNMLVGQVYIQPARTAEFVVIDFTVEPTGATFA